MLLNQTDVAVDEKLKNVILTIDSSPETDIGDYESGYEYSFGETIETSSETAWTSNAYCSECWNLAEITLFLMKFDEIL